MKKEECKHEYHGDGNYFRCYKCGNVIDEESSQAPTVEESKDDRLTSEKLEKDIMDNYVDQINLVAYKSTIDTPPVQSAWEGTPTVITCAEAGTIQKDVLVVPLSTVKSLLSKARAEATKDADEEWRMAIGWGESVTNGQQGIEVKNYELLKTLLDKDSVE